MSLTTYYLFVYALLIAIARRFLFFSLKSCLSEQTTLYFFLQQMNDVEENNSDFIFRAVCGFIRVRTHCFL